MKPMTNATYLYIGNADGPDISAFSVDPQSGLLTPIGVSAIPGAREPCYSLPMTVSPDKCSLYVAIRREPWRVCRFAIDPHSGALDYRDDGALADNTCFLSMDRTGRFLFSASYQGDRIAINRIGDGGEIAPPHQAIATDPKSHSILIDARNRFALSASLGGDKMYQWRFDSQRGLLSANDAPFVSVAANSGPRHFVFHPNGAFVYLLNELDGTIWIFDYESATGLLSKRGIVDVWPLPPGKSTVSAADIYVTPDGRFVYATARQANTIATLRVSENGGDLELLSHIDTEDSPRGFAIAPDGRHLYCAGQKSNRVSCYAIEPDSGRLHKFAECATGGNPNWIEIVDLRGAP